VSAIVVDAGARVVRRDGLDIHLAPKAFDLLLILVSHQPNAVAHERLHDELWPGVHVSETSLAALITQLRKALGDGGHGRPLIRTLHRVGYAFAGDAVIVNGGTAAAAATIARLIWHGVTFDLTAGDTVIGRDRGCTVRVDADSVSRRHARVTVRAEDASVADLGSKNGTWVAGARIRDAVALSHGMSFRIGSETMRFEIVAPEDSTRTLDAARSHRRSPHSDAPVGSD
jgi:DNA-binding winged helix-turn-helix (wHTH) protein